MPTDKELKSIKKKRSTTLKKLDKMYEKNNKINDQLELERKKWMECMEKISDKELRVTKKEWKALEKPCKKLMKNMTKKHKESAKILEKTKILEKEVGDIETKYNISMSASY